MGMPLMELIFRWNRVDAVLMGRVWPRHGSCSEGLDDNAVIWVARRPQPIGWGQELSTDRPAGVPIASCEYISWSVAQQVAPGSVFSVHNATRAIKLAS
jgi:hypothetical protein